MYDIKYAEEFTDNLKELSASRRAEILDTIATQLPQSTGAGNSKQENLTRAESTLGS
jgi:mRNA-degrading endonuclease RelE of RelBE toxin-antitoxin system